MNLSHGRYSSNVEDLRGNPLLALLGPSSNQDNAAAAVATPAPQTFVDRVKSSPGLLLFVGVVVWWMWPKKKRRR